MKVKLKAGPQPPEIRRLAAMIPAPAAAVKSIRSAAAQIYKSKDVMS